MRLPNLAGALVIAIMVAASLHVTAKPAAAADTGSICAYLWAAQLRIETSSLSAYAKAWALAAINKGRAAAGCTA